VKRGTKARPKVVHWTVTPTPSIARDTFNSVALTALIYEFPFGDPRLTDALIKRRLRRAAVGTFDVVRVARLRTIKNLVQAEVGKRERSRFYVGTHGRYAEIADFDVAQLAAYVRALEPIVTSREARWFAQFAVFVYHLL